MRNACFVEKVENGYIVYRTMERNSLLTPDLGGRLVYHTIADMHMGVDERLAERTLNPGPPGLGQIDTPMRWTGFREAVTDAGRPNPRTPGMTQVLANEVAPFTTEDFHAAEQALVNPAYTTPGEAREARDP